MESAKEDVFENSQIDKSQNDAFADFVLDSAPDLSSEAESTEAVVDDYDGGSTSYSYDSAEGEENKEEVPRGDKSEERKAESKNSKEHTKSRNGPSGGGSGISAKMWVNTLDLLVSKTCGAMSDKPSSMFVLDTDEKDYYLEATEEYLKTVDVDVSPTTVFVFATLGLVVPNIWKAYSVKKKNDSAKQAFKKANPDYDIKVKRATAHRAEQAQNFGNEARVVNIDAKPKKSENDPVSFAQSNVRNTGVAIPIEGIDDIPCRRNFEIIGDEYKYSRNNVYMPAGEREPVHEEVKGLWAKGYKSKQIRTHLGID